MISFRRISTLHALLLSLAVLAGGSVFGQDARVSRKEKSAGERKPEAPVRAFPRLDLRNGRRLEYVATISADGRYRTLSRFRRFLASNEAPPSQAEEPQAGTGVSPEQAAAASSGHPKEVPDSVTLRSNERAVPDVQPPGHAVEVEKEPSRLADLRDSIVSFAYGAEAVLRRPSRLTTDSRERVIITDPDAVAVHVIDPEGKNSFRIVGGQGRRLQSPDDVAVDKDDNIYVADAKRGMIIVYKPDGKFLRYIGDFKGENFFQSPAAVAVDRKGGRLYILDRPRNLLYIMDLEGTVLKSIGVHGGGTALPGQFKDPVAVTVRDNKLVVFDDGANRVQLFDLNGSFLSAFRLQPPVTVRPGEDLRGSLAVDNTGNVYVVYPGDATVRVFSGDGKLLSSLGCAGTRYGEFESPSGVWIDENLRLYVTDARAMRIQVFRLSAAQ